MLWLAHNQQLLGNQFQFEIPLRDVQDDTATAIYFLYQSAQQASGNDRFEAVSSMLKDAQPPDLMRRTIIAGGSTGAAYTAADEALQTPWLRCLPLEHCEQSLEKKYPDPWKRKMAAIDLFFTVNRVFKDRGPGKKDAEAIRALTQTTTAPPHTASAGGAAAPLGAPSTCSSATQQRRSNNSSS